MTKISHARLLAVSISLAQFEAKAKEKLLEQWERVTFRIFGMRSKDARTRVGEFVRLAQEVQSMGGSSKEYTYTLCALRRLGDGEFSIKEALKGIRHEDCYEGWQEELRYFMFRYEEYLAKQAGQSFLNEQWDRIWEASVADSIEHVYPQNPASGGPWTGALGRGRGQREAHLNRLGNLVLLPPGVNSRIGNREFLFKKAEYRKTGLLLLDDVTRKSKWTKNAIDERERKLLRFAAQAWADI